MAPTTMESSAVLRARGESAAASALPLAKSGRGRGFGAVGRAAGPEPRRKGHRAAAPLAVELAVLRTEVRRAGTGAGAATAVEDDDEAEEERV